MAFYMHVWFSFSFPETWTSIGYCDWDRGENLFLSDANVQTKLSFWKSSKKRQNETSAIIFTAFHTKRQQIQIEDMTTMLRYD